MSPRVNSVDVGSTSVDVDVRSKALGKVRHHLKGPASPQRSPQRSGILVDENFKDQRRWTINLNDGRERSGTTQKLSESEFPRYSKMCFIYLLLKQGKF